MALAGTLDIQIQADVARLRRDMDQVKSVTRRTMTSVENSARQAGRALGALGVSLGAVFLVRFIKGTIDAQDALSKLSQKVNISVESLVGWQHAASLSGTDAAGLTKGLKTLTTQMFDASMGLLESQRNFAALSIEVKKADGTLRNADDVMIEIADRFAKMADGTEKTALAVKLFGKAGLDMIPMLNQGSEALAEMRREGNLLNPVTAESARNAEIFNDNMSRLTKSLSTGFIKTLNDLLPLLADMSNELWNSREASLGAESSFKPLLETIRTLIVLGSEFAFVWRTIGIEIAGVGARIDAFGNDKSLSDVNKMMKQILDEQLRLHEEFINRVMGIGTPGVQNTPDRSTTNTRTGVPPTIITATGKADKDPILEMIEKQTEAAEKQAEAYKRNLGLLDATTEVARVRYDIEFGGLTLANQAAQNALLLQAGLLDAANAHIERQQAIVEMQEVMNNSEQQQLEAMQATRELTAQAEKAEEQKLEDLRDRLATEQEIQRENYNDDFDLLKTNLDNKKIALEEYYELMGRLVAKSEAEQKDIFIRNATEAEKFNAKTNRQKAETIFGYMEDITAGVAQHNRQLFEINKVAGIANAIINAYEGISKTLSTYPYPYNLALAALHAAAAFAQVSAISSTTFGGSGGAAPSLSGSTAAPPVTPVTNSEANAGTSQTTIINFKGSTSERKLVKEFAKTLNDNTHDGGRVLVN